MPFTPIVGTLAYVVEPRDDTVLLIRRNARRSDDHFGKVNGVGGKVERDEDVVSSLQRELAEEADIVATKLSLRGTVAFSDFGPRREEWLVFVFLVTEWSGTVAASNEEGTLEWVPRSLLLDACGGDEAAQAALPMWAGDKHFVPLVFDGDDRLFHGTMPYDGDVPIGWSHVRL